MDEARIKDNSMRHTKFEIMVRTVIIAIFEYSTSVVNVEVHNKAIGYTGPKWSTIVSSYKNCFYDAILSFEKFLFAV